MWSVVVVLEPPVVEEQLGFEESVEALEVEQLAAEMAVEGFGLGCPAVAPGRAVEDRDFRTVVDHEVNVDREGEGGGVVPWNGVPPVRRRWSPLPGGSSWSCSVVVLVCNGS